MVIVVVVSWHPSVGLSFPPSEQEKQWVTWAEWNFAKKPREIREFDRSHWSLDIGLGTVEGFAGRFVISGWFQVAIWQKAPNLSVQQLWNWKSIGRIMGVWAQGMLEKSQCDLLHVELPQSFMLQGRVSWITVPFIYLFIVSFWVLFIFLKTYTHTDTDRHTHTQTHTCIMFLPHIQKKMFMCHVNW